MRKRLAVVLFALIFSLLPLNVNMSAAVSYSLFDVNGDGIISSADARIALRASVNLIELNTAQKKAADIDSDTAVTAADARYILRRAVGLTDNISANNSSAGESSSNEAEKQRQLSDCVAMGSGETSVRAVLGSPQKTFTEQVENGSVTSYVYNADYSKLTVIQFCGGCMSGVFTFDKELKTGFDGSVFCLASFAGTTAQAALRRCGYSVSLYHADFAGDTLPYAMYISRGYDYNYRYIDGVTEQEYLGFLYTNALRAMNGVSSLARSEAASKAARLHSRDMADNGFFLHTSSDGSTFSQRLARQNIDYCYAAENICAGYRNAFDGTDGLYNSEPHRKTILNGSLKYLGVGCALSSAHIGYMTQDFYG